MKLPEIQQRGAVTRGPQSSVSAAEVANPYQQIANAFDNVGAVYAAKAEDDARIAGENGVFRDANGDLKVELRSNLTQANRVYNRAVSQSLAAQSELDAKGAMTRFQLESRGDPAAFATSAKAYKDQRMISLPKDLRGPIGTMLDSEIRMGYDGVQRQKFQSDMTMSKSTKLELLAMKDDERAALARQGGVETPEYAQRFEETRTLWTELSSNPIFGISPKEAELKIKQAMSRDKAEAMLGEADKAIETGGTEAARKLADRILVDTSLTFSPAERRQYAGLINQTISGYRAEQRAAIQPLKDLAKDRVKLWESGASLDAADDDELISSIRKSDPAYASFLNRRRVTLRQDRDLKNLGDGDQVALLTQNRNATGGASAGPADVVAAKTFLQTRTDKDASHIDGMDGSFSVKVARMIEAAPAGIRDKLGIYSGARSVERQTELWEEAVIKYGSAAEARKWVAPPGNSQHNHGKAADLSYEGQSLKNAPPEVVAWVHQNAVQFGLKFPLANENWHVEDDTTRGGVGTSALTGEAAKTLQTEVTADLRESLGDWKNELTKGNVPDAESLDLMSRQLALVDDQDLRSDYAALFRQSDAFSRGYATDPAAAEAFISSLDARAAGAGQSLAEAEIVDAYKKGTAAANLARSTEPLAYGVRRGLIDPLPALDLGAPDTWADTFSGLQKRVSIMQARGEVGNVSALPPQMQKQVSDAIANSPPGDAIKLLSSMSGAMRPDTYLTTLGSLYSTGQGRAAAAAGALVSSNPDAAEGILRGQKMLRENPLFAPKKTDENADTLNDILPAKAFSPAVESARQGLLEAATARYADLSAQAGDTSGELNADRMEQSVKEVTGGILEFNSAQVVAPRYGMSQDDFDKMVGSLTDRDLDGAVTDSGVRVKADELRDQGRLRAVADGRYLLEFGSEAAPGYAKLRPSAGSYGKSSVFVLDLRGR